MATFTNNQNDAFFENGPQMGLSAVQRRRLAAEGLSTVSDFQDFKEDQITQAIKNMKTAIPAIPGIAEVVDGQGNVVQAAVPGTPGVPPCLVPAKCVLRLKVASIAYHYYVDTGRTPTPANMNYSLVLRGFYEEFEAIEKMRDSDALTVPHLSKTNTVIRWVESFKDHLSRSFGVRNCPLTYLIRADATVEPEANAPLAPGKAYSEKHGSLLEEMVNRLSHNDTLYKLDNGALFTKLDEATRSTIYAPIIKPYSKSKNGRDAFLALIGSHAGNDKWEQIQKEKTKYLLNTKWNGRQFGLDKFCNLHRSAYIALEEASTHVQFQLPNEFSRVGYLLDNIENNDPDLRAAIASIRANTNNMRNNFEAAVTFMLPMCPYRKAKSNSNKNGDQFAEISDANALKNFTSSKTGVDFRWHTPEEYKKLSKAQRIELYKWQTTKQGKAAIKKDRDKYMASRDNSSGGGASSYKHVTKKQMAATISELKGRLASGGGGAGSNGDATAPSNPPTEEKPTLFTAAQVSTVLKAFSNIGEPSKPAPQEDGSISELQLQQIVKRMKRN